MYKVIIIDFDQLSRFKNGKPIYGRTQTLKRFMFKRNALKFCNELESRIAKSYDDIKVVLRKE